MLKYWYIYILIILFIVLSIFYFKKNSKVIIVPNKAKKIVVIDPGHGGKDPGTIYGNIQEKDIVLEISKVLYDILKDTYEVYLTRKGDYDLSSPKVNLRKRSDFDNRIKLINDLNADVYLSIHLNYYDDGKYYGAQIFYDDINSQNKTLAQLIQNSLNINNNDRKIKQINDLYLYKNLDVPGVLIECGFISNANERRLLKTAKYQKKIAVQIKEALNQYFGN